MSELGIVLIGRNEGERLRQCLKSVIGRGYIIVYVDSGSTDGSIELARAMGVDVAQLDLSLPFTMARGRNLGFTRLLEIEPRLRYVQFVDGDCEVVDGWLEKALAVIKTTPEAAVVCGRRRERHVEQSVYNRLADLDWDRTVGPVDFCGGDIMTRVENYREVGGFRPDLIAVEDIDLCVRFRKRGWKILRIDADMTLHDIAMTRFRQWWHRTVRTGFGYADGMHLHGSPPERLFVRDVRSILFWGALVPLAIVLLAWPTRGLSLILLGGYLVLYWRIYRYGLHCGWTDKDSQLYALSCTAAKFPMLVGVISYAINWLSRRPKQLIEYKKA